LATASDAQLSELTTKATFEARRRRKREVKVTLMTKASGDRVSWKCIRRGLGLRARDWCLGNA